MLDEVIFLKNVQFIRNNWCVFIILIDSPILSGLSGLLPIPDGPDKKFYCSFCCKIYFLFYVFLIVFTGLDLQIKFTPYTTVK